MASFRNSCDNSCCSRHGGNNFGSLGGFRSGNSMLRSNSGNILGSFVSGSLQGFVETNLNGEFTGEMAGKIDGFKNCIGSGFGFGNLGDLGNITIRMPFAVQFGNRNN